METDQGATGVARSWPTVLDEITGALESLTAALVAEEDFAVLLELVCEQVVHAVPGVDEATITLIAGPGHRTIASTSEVVTELDQDQYQAEAGPCVDAAGSGRIVRVSVREAAARWPRFARDSAAAGFGSFLSAPMVIDDDHGGALNCYSALDHGFAELDEKLLDLYSGVVTATLRMYSRYQRSRVTIEQLQTALDSRAVIDQAKGVLMAIRQITAEEAFSLLVEQSQRENRKVRDIAAEFIAQATGTA